MSICKRLCEERKIPPYGIDEFGGKTIDAAQTFAPNPGWFGVTVKCILFGWSLFTMFQGLIEQAEPKFFYFVFLTNWSLIITIIYFGASLFNSLVPGSSHHVSAINKFAWFMFSVAAPAEVLVTVLFWGLEYQGPEYLTYRTVMVHGVFALLLLIEGLVLNRIPIRISQFKFFFIYIVLYLIWTLVHSYLGIGDPTSEDDDAIYSVLQWEQELQQTGILAAFIIVLGVPLFFGFVWILSLYSCPCNWDGSHRRLLSSGTKNEKLVRSRRGVEV